MTDYLSLHKQVSRAAEREKLDALMGVKAGSLVQIDDVVAVDVESVIPTGKSTQIKGTLHDPESLSYSDRYRVNVSAERHGRVRRVLGLVFGNPIESAPGSVSYVIHNSPSQRQLDELSKARFINEPVQSIRRI